MTAHSCKAASQNDVGLSGRCNQEHYKKSDFHVEIGADRREIKSHKIGAFVIFYGAFVLALIERFTKCHNMTTT